MLLALKLLFKHHSRLTCVYLLINKDWIRNNCRTTNDWSLIFSVFRSTEVQESSLSCQNIFLKGLPYSVILLRRSLYVEILIVKASVAQEHVDMYPSVCFQKNAPKCVHHMSLYFKTKAVIWDFQCKILMPWIKGKENSRKQLEGRKFKVNNQKRVILFCLV